MSPPCSASSRPRSPSGRAFAQHIEADAGQSRADAIAAEQPAKGAAGAPYQLQYAFKRAGAEPLWLEDTGRWFAGADGRPMRAHGVVRIINERHEREHTLLQAARFDALTGEMNRNYLTEVLTATLDETRALPRLLRFPFDRHRSPRPAQRGLWLRRRPRR